MTKPLIRVAVTGGAGQIAYNLLFRIGSGEMFGFNQPVALHILEVEAAMPSLEGVKMELQDSAFPQLKELHIGSDPYRLFEGVHYAILIGAKPRGPGMERAELLSENGKIFINQGRALDAAADRNVKVLVVGNPCNTNALIAMTNAPSLPRENFFAMTRLDENRAAAQLAIKAGVSVAEISQVTIWGNHSSTQVPDHTYAKCRGQAISDLIADSAWFEKSWIPTVQKRGAAIIAARGKSSAASAASAALDTIRAIREPTEEGRWYSLALCSDHNSYGVEEGLIFSFPCRTSADGTVSLVTGLEWESGIKEKIRASEQELIEERQLALPSLQPNR